MVENEAPGPSQERASAMATIRPRSFWAHGTCRAVVEPPVGVAARVSWMKGPRPKRDKVMKRERRGQRVKGAGGVGV